MVLPGSKIWRPHGHLDGRLLPDRRQFPELAAASMGWRAYKKVYPNSSLHAAECGFTRLQKNVEFAARVAELSEEAAQGSMPTILRPDTLSSVAN
jgi:hypothetical protein